MTIHSLLGVTKGTKYPIEFITDRMKKAVKKLGEAMWLVKDEIGMEQLVVFVATNTIFNL